VGERHQFTVYGDHRDGGDLDKRLRDFRIKDKNGESRYRKSQGRQLPVYEAPKGIGFVRKDRGAIGWNGCAWVPDRTVAMMLTLLERNGPVFAELHEHRVARNRWINGLTLQTTDPAYE
jgi:hypothetical protein